VNNFHIPSLEFSGNEQNGQQLGTTNFDEPTTDRWRRRGNAC
jgi:hypothetical protein